MKITMMKASEQGKTFTFEGKKYTPNDKGIYEDITELSWIIKNANSLVEVEQEDITKPIDELLDKEMENSNDTK